MILQQLPDRGWGVLRAHKEIVALYCIAGYIHVQVTGMPNVFQARLTALGRELKGKP
jgi:hypothetical protein